MILDDCAHGSRLVRLGGADRQLLRWLFGPDDLHYFDSLRLWFDDFASFQTCRIVLVQRSDNVVNLLVALYFFQAIDVGSMPLTVDVR